MEKMVNLNLPGVQEMSKEELMKVEGGLPLLILAIITAWAVVCILTD